jgi:hypothetical protein
VRQAGTGPFPGQTQELCASSGVRTDVQRQERGKADFLPALEGSVGVGPLECLDLGAHRRTIAGRSAWPGRESRRTDSGAGQHAGVAGSMVAAGHRAATRSAFDADRRCADSGASGRRLGGHVLRDEVPVQLVLLAPRPYREVSELRQEGNVSVDLLGRRDAAVRRREFFGLSPWACHCFDRCVVSVCQGVAQRLRESEGARILGSALGGDAGSPSRVILEAVAPRFFRAGDALESVEKLLTELLAVPNA